MEDNYINKKKMFTKRKSWIQLRLEKELDDHHMWRLGPLLFVAIFVISGLSWGLGWNMGWSMGWDKTASFSYSGKAYRQLYLNLFGGEIAYEHAFKVYDALEAFEQPGYNSFDIAAINIYTTATSYRRNKFEAILKRPQGRVRILLLDPRMALKEKTREKFNKVSGNFGDPADITFAECYLSTLALIKAKKDLEKYGDRFQVRFYSKPHPDADENYYILGRSYHKYSTIDTSMRFDIIVPYGNKKEKNIDSGLRRAYLIKDAPKNNRVVKYTSAFEKVWETSTPISEITKEMPDIMSLRLKNSASAEGR